MNTFNLDPDAFIALIPEGGAESAICDILLDGRLFLFGRDQLIEERPLSGVRSADEFCRRYLKFAYEKKITVIRVLDSRREAFCLKKPYNMKVERVIDVITAPEIEILVIISLGKYKEFSKSHQKPSWYCRHILKIQDVKTRAFIENHFSDPKCLIAALKEYKRLHRPANKMELSLFDLLKPEP